MLESCPTTLYKFIDDASVAAPALSGTVKFTPIKQLNDPAELNPTLNREAVNRSLANFRERGFSDEDMVHLRRQQEILRLLAPSEQVIALPRTKEEATMTLQARFYDLLEELDARLTSTARKIAANVGLLCLSSRFDALPMWAHYARNASGFAVEYRDLHRVFRGDSTGVLRQPRAVIYEEEMTGVTFDPRSHESLFFSKFIDWRYEQEVRVVLPLRDCRPVDTGKGRLYLFDLPPGCVRRLILGWNMPDEIAAGIRRHAAEIDPTVQISRARFAGGRVHLIELAEH